MRLIAIGDIHGCLAALRALLDAVQPAAADRLVFLGDYIDKGPDSAGVLDCLMALSQRHDVVTLLGNHEALHLGTQAEFRETNGVEADEFGLTRQHWRFFSEFCIPLFVAETHFFVHGGADARAPLEKQLRGVLLNRKFRDVQPHVSGKIMVCGHTPQESGWPLNLGHAVCIDTGCVYGRWLTALDVHSGAVWQASQRGRVRTGTLAGGPPAA